MLKKIYVVFGSSGEYDSFQRWDVRAFMYKKVAERHILKCYEELDRIKRLQELADAKEEFSFDYKALSKSKKNQADPFIECSLFDLDITYQIFELDFDMGIP